MTFTFLITHQFIYLCLFPRKTESILNRDAMYGVSYMPVLGHNRISVFV